MPVASSQKGLPTALNSLSLSPRASKPKPKEAPVADSWEEASSSSSGSSDDDSDSSSDPSPRPDTSASGFPNAPPPTPISPNRPQHDPNMPQWSSFSDAYGPQSPTSASYERGTRQNAREREKRPEKSTATAGRMIAGALGVRAPKKTEEERKYERAIREKESKRIEEEKRREREKSEERKKVWDD